MLILQRVRQLVDVDPGVEHPAHRKGLQRLGQLPDRVERLRRRVVVSEDLRLIEIEQRGDDRFVRVLLVDQSQRAHHIAPVFNRVRQRLLELTAEVRRKVLPIDLDGVHRRRELQSPDPLDRRNLLGDGRR